MRLSNHYPKDRGALRFSFSILLDAATRNFVVREPSICRSRVIALVLRTKQQPRDSEPAKIRVNTRLLPASSTTTGLWLSLAQRWDAALTFGALAWNVRL